MTLAYSKVIKLAKQTLFFGLMVKYLVQQLQGQVRYTYLSLFLTLQLNKMRQSSFLFVASAFLFSCQKSTTHSRPPRTISDTLMLYSQQAVNGKSNILLKSFKSGETKTIINSATHSFATNLRLVYIKSGNTLGFARLDGV